MQRCNPVRKCIGFSVISVIFYSFYVVTGIFAIGREDGITHMQMQQYQYLTIA